MLQRLGLPYTREWLTLDITNEADDPNSLRPLLLSPPCQIFEMPMGQTRCLSQAEFHNRIVNAHALTSVESR